MNKKRQARMRLQMPRDTELAIFDALSDIIRLFHISEHITATHKERSQFEAVIRLSIEDLISRVNTCENGEFTPRPDDIPF